MKKNIFICLFFITSGCTVFQPDESTLIQPKLLRQSELPPLRESLFSNRFEFYCEMLINTNGDVERAKLLTGSGDETWDSLAALTLLDWKYTPAIYGGHPIKLMVRRKIKVVFVEPKVLSLSEIQLNNPSQADSVYRALINGADFTTLVLKYSISPTREIKGYLGDVNIKHFSDNISVALSDLNEGDFTKPLRYGEHYIIFKRSKIYN